MPLPTRPRRYCDPRHLFLAIYQPLNRTCLPQVASGFGGVMLSWHAEKVEASGVDALAQNPLCQGQFKTVALKNTQSHEKESKSRPQRIHVPNKMNR